jgi:hypothetical protein
MSLVNFSPESIAQLRAILGSFGDNEIAREIKSTVPYIESRYFQVSSIVEKETEGGDKYNEYKAFEVLPDGTPVDDGIIFDSDATSTFKPADPVYFDNLRINELIFSGSVELGYAYQVEAVWRELENEDPVYYIIPKGGGGGGIQYGVIVSRIEGERPLYKIDVYGNKQISPTLSETGSATLDMYIMSNYAELPSGFQLAINPTETGYEPFDLQDQCFGEVISFEGNGVYKFSTYTLPDEGGFYLGEILATAPNIDYGSLRNGSKQVLYFNKYANAWYINPATFGVY